MLGCLYSFKQLRKGNGNANSKITVLPTGIHGLICQNMQ